MRRGTKGFRVAVIGASSLLGKELLHQFEERGFPVEQLLTYEAESGEDELPIVDLGSGGQRLASDESVRSSDLDFTFLVTSPEPWPSFLAKPVEGVEAGCAVIDLSGRLEPSASAEVRIPMLEGETTSRPERQGVVAIAPHGATIVTALLLRRLSARFEIERVTAHIFSPAAELGSRAIEELQKQTINLLSFQKIPQDVYGGRMAFNLLPRLAGKNSTANPQMEARLRRELGAHLGNWAPLPSLRVVQAPIFYSLSMSLYIEAKEVVLPAAAETALAGDPVRISKATEAPPSAAEASDTETIWVDRVEAGPGHPSGLWLWVVADPLRLAAANAIQTAESIRKRRSAG